MGYLIQKFFLGTGGLVRWLFFQSLNALFSKNYPNELEYYMDNENNSKDRNSMSSMHKNFVVGIIAFVALLLIIEKIES